MRMRHIASALAILLMAASVNASDAPAGAVILHARFTPAAWAARFLTFEGPDKRMKLNVMVPYAVVYDAAGRQLAEKKGYGTGAASWIAAVLKQQPAANAPVLGDLVRDLVTPEGKTFPRVISPEQPVVVVYGAAWCAPCRALKTDLEKVSGITLLDLDIDQAKMNWQEVMAAAQKKNGN